MEIVSWLVSCSPWGSAETGGYEKHTLESHRL